MIITPILRMQLLQLQERERERKMRRLVRRYWVHPVNDLRARHGVFHILYTQIRGYPDKFQDYLRMSTGTFDILLDLVREHITFQDTRLLLAVSPEQRLVVTLRFLASGESYASLHFQFRMGISTIAKIVCETCEALWKVLQPLYLPQPFEEMWRTSSQGLLMNANFPNCIGALDGKHIRIHKPAHSGSLYYNYKHFFSIILMAICDTNYKFLAVDIGAFGQNNDSRVFKESNIGKCLYSNALNIPGPQTLPGSEGPPLPHVLVADEAFQMHTNLLKPFSRRGLNNQRRVFNYRLTRARRYVECTFGLLASKWRVLTTTINLKPENVDKIVKACVVTHNFVLCKDPMYTIVDDMHGMP